MSFLTGAFIIGAALITAAISGVFGMAGGLLLKGALALVLPVSATFVCHGILQLVANGWRAILHRQHIAWRIIGESLRPESVTTSGRTMPSSSQAFGSSLMRPGPDQTRVG